MKTLLWLDDCRDPLDKKIDWLVFSPIGRNVTAIWVKDYVEFTSYILENGLPDGICFDHDLSDIQALKSGFAEFMEEIEVNEKTGYDCAKWLVDYCLDNNLKLPLFNSQSANPAGRKNIESLLNNFNTYEQNRRN